MGVDLFIRKCKNGFFCTYIHPYKGYEVIRFFNNKDELYSFMCQLDFEFGFCIAHWE